MTVAVTRCRSCGAPIFWAVLQGRPHPVDAKPKAGGNLEIDTPPGSYVVATVVRADPNVGRYVSHYSSCPDAVLWRKAKRKR